jgi:predicted Zn-dependent protease
MPPTSRFRPDPAHAGPRPPRARRAGGFATAAARALQPIAPALVGTSAAHAQQLAPRAQSLPDLGDESQAMISPVQERKLGESVVRQIRQQGGYMDDPEINDYLQDLGHRLVAAVPDGKQDF